LLKAFFIGKWARATIRATTLYLAWSFVLLSATS